MAMKPRTLQESSSVLVVRAGVWHPDLSICLLRLHVIVATGRFANGSYFSPTILFSYQRKEQMEDLLRTHVLTGHLGHAL